MKVVFVISAYILLAGVFSFLARFSGKRFCFRCTLRVVCTLFMPLTCSPRVFRVVVRRILNRAFYACCCTCFSSCRWPKSTTFTPRSLAGSASTCSELRSTRYGRQTRKTRGSQRCNSPRPPGSLFRARTYYMRTSRQSCMREYTHV